MFKIALLSGHRGFEKPTREDEIAFAYCQEMQSIIQKVYSEKYVSYIVPSFGQFTQNEAIMKEVYHTNDNKANFLVSIHCDWSNANVNAKGFTIFYNQITTAIDKELARNSKRLAELCAGQLISAGFSFWGKEPVAEDHLAGCGNLAVCSYSKMPAVLIELGFLSNKQDAENLEKPETKKAICNAIIKGIVNYNV
jgi:N-acetylmuramoyl-L-alanine amidase